MNLPFVPHSATVCPWRSLFARQSGRRSPRQGSPVGFAASFAADEGDSLSRIAEAEEQDAQSGNSGSDSSLVPCPTLESRHDRSTTRCSPRCRALQNSSSPREPATPRRNENAKASTPTTPTRSPTFHPRFLQLDRSPLPALRI